jgi:hypothetical protein
MDVRRRVWACHRNLIQQLMNALRDTPPHVVAKLLSWGGKNPYGEVNWRVILAQNHLVQRAGVWTDFDPNTDMVEFTGVDYKFHSRQIAPDRVRVGMFWVPLYQVRGWILERWFPPLAYGSKEQWESALSQDGETPMMGPFPERGGYFMLSGGGPWDEIPNLEDIRQAIATWENGSHLHGRMDVDSIAEAVRLAELESAEREQSNHDLLMEHIAYARTHNLDFIKGNPNLSAFRNGILAKQGFTSHY